MFEHVVGDPASSPHQLGVGGARTYKGGPSLDLAMCICQTAARQINCHSSRNKGTALHR